MRDAALMIAALDDDFAPSLAARVGRAVAALLTALQHRRRAHRALRHLHRLDPHLLRDIGLEPVDLGTLDPTLSAPEATRRLAAAARRRTRAVEERWARG